MHLISILLKRSGWLALSKRVATVQAFSAQTGFSNFGFELHSRERGAGDFQTYSSTKLQ